SISHQKSARPKRWQRAQGSRGTRVEQKRILPALAAIWPLEIPGCPLRRGTPSLIVCAAQPWRRQTDGSVDGAQTQRSASVFLRRENYVAHTCCGSSRSCCCACSALVWQLQRQGPVDANDSHRWLLSCVRFQRSRTHHSTVANHV